MQRKAFTFLFHYILYVFILNYTLSAQNSIPVISNIIVIHDSTLNRIEVGYDLSDADSDDVKITVSISEDNGQTFLSNITVSGDVGFPVTPGPSKTATIIYTPSSFHAKDYLIKLVADDLIEIDIQTVVNEVSMDSLKSDLIFVDGTRHYITGTAHLEAVKDFIEDRFLEKDLQTSRQEVIKGGYSGHNIIGRLPGQEDESKTYIIDGHFDSVSNTSGADDNGSGTVGMLEAMRVLSKYNFKHSIRFIGFDFEESVGGTGLAGSLEYTLNGIEDYESIEGVINFEMIGFYSDEKHSQEVPPTFLVAFPDQVSIVEADSFRGNFIVLATIPNSHGLSNAFESSAATYVPDLKVLTFDDPGGGGFLTDLSRSDHFSFWLSGLPAVMLTDGAEYRNTNYHTPYDTIGALDFTFMSNVVKAAVATIAELAGIQHSSYAVVNMAGEVVKEMSSLVGIEEPDCEFGIMHFSEANQLLVRTGSCFHEKLNIRLYTIAGRLLQNFEFNNQADIRIKTDGFNSGLYIAVVDDGKNQKSRQFFIK